jgi:uncharacterized membrane protein
LCFEDNNEGGESVVSVLWWLVPLACIIVGELTRI